MLFRVDLAEEKILLGESLAGMSGVGDIMMQALNLERTRQA